MNDLTNIKAGDKVFISSSHGFLSSDVVDRTTAAHIVVGPYKFRRKDGRRVGSGAWSYMYLEDVTPETTARYNRQRDNLRRTRLADKLRDINLRDFSLEILQQIKQLIAPDLSE